LDGEVVDAEGGVGGGEEGVVEEGVHDSCAWVSVFCRSGLFFQR
jgi:hypothetical protein